MRCYAKPYRVDKLINYSKTQAELINFLRIKTIYTFFRDKHFHWLSENNNNIETDFQAFTTAERENMVKFAECFSDQLIPYVQYCIHAIFPPAQIALHLGISVGQLQKEVTT